MITLKFIIKYFIILISFTITLPIVQAETFDVSPCNLNGYRQANARVNVGYAKDGIIREYWAETNEHRQLIKVTAKEIILQDEQKERVVNGRYCEDEAKVSGTESKDYDEGHAIADSLGGESNAYNITPQHWVVNRHGDQAYFEKDIRDSGGAYDFVYEIEYLNTQTQIPSKYKVTYRHKITNEIVQMTFDNQDPEFKKENAITYPNKLKLDDIDTNQDGKVSIKEAKKAGILLPVCREDWLYPYMHDKDGDGCVGE